MVVVFPMPKRQWAQFARDELQAGRSAQVRPRGHSMTGRIGDGDLVTIAPCGKDDLAADDIVLARVQRRRFSHLVLHLIHERDENLFLIGSNNGRLDGWIGFDDIFGKVSAVEAPNDE